jgi:hypothetical protein
MIFTLGFNRKRLPSLSCPVYVTARIDFSSMVYCDGPLLKTVQLSGIFDDSKTFVDLYQLHDPNVTIDK